MTPNIGGALLAGVFTVGFCVFWTSLIVIVVRWMWRR